MLNGGMIDSAHMALDSDCFSNATASTRRCSPACTRLAATIAVAPPTDPAVCTRSSGLPIAPSASARYSSGILTPPTQARGLSDHHGVDVGEPGAGVRQGPVDCLPAQPGNRHVGALAAVVGLAGAQHGGPLPHGACLTVPASRRLPHGAW